MILLDWTRMGKSYCVAGAVAEAGSFRVVRPLLGKHHDAPVRNVGWYPWHLEGHARWDIFELIGPTPAEPQPPHLEDVWVHSLRPRRRSASPELRRAVLQATTIPAGEPVFGLALTLLRSAAYLEPGTGQRSLATVVTSAAQISFHTSRRAGAEEAEVRVALLGTPLGDRLLPVKDHFLLLQAERTGADLTRQVEALQAIVGRMGEQVAVRVGLSRSHLAGGGQGIAACWLMVDGFFSLDDPQP